MSKPKKKPRARRRDPAVDCPPKLCGGDIELGNFIEGVSKSGGTGQEASHALLSAMPGIPHARQTQTGYSSSSLYGSPSGGSDYLQDWDWLHGGGQSGAVFSSSSGFYGTSLYASGSSAGAGGYNRQDVGRKYLPCNGGCVYIDLNHLELCLPEVLSAADHVAAWRAMLILAREAMNRVNASMPEGQAVQVLVNNSDGQNNSYGSHMDFLISRRCWENLHHHKLQQMLFLASYFCSSIVFTGQGKVGAENGAPRAGYQISQRADFIESLTGPQTTWRRPICNSRDESLAGPRSTWSHRATLDSRLARLHVIVFDNTLAQTACFLKVGVTQIVLAMIEQEQIDLGLILDDPVEAIEAWSHDPDLRRRVKLLDGEAAFTAVEVQQSIAERAARFVEAGRAEGIVPEARRILSLWRETLELLSRRDFDALAGRLDWVLKRQILRQVMRERDLDWDAPEIKHLDLLYGALRGGLFFSVEKAGAVEAIVPPQRIERFVHEPPPDTRAYLRAELLRRLDPDDVVSIDWDEIRIRLRRNDDSGWPDYAYFRLDMHNPLGFTRPQCETLLTRAESLPDLLRRLGFRETSRDGKLIERESQPTASVSSSGSQIVLRRRDPADDRETDR